ncbi:MAG: sensor histidine kinase, partial [Solirubrobacteraceae bacterium]
MVDGDPHQLRQVIANLMRNAFVHTPPSTPIEVTVTADGGRARVEVRDHGPGLPADAGEAIFERFWRADAAAGAARPEPVSASRSSTRSPVPTAAAPARPTPPAAVHCSPSTCPPAASRPAEPHAPGRATAGARPAGPTATPR